jgi:hypothetical protein
MSMPRPQVDLNAHINRTVVRGNPADFPVTLQPVFLNGPTGPRPIPARRAIVREDTGEAIAVVSDRYKVVPHSRILDLVEQAIGPLDLSPVPRGIYVDHCGARMRAVFKFPSLARPVVGQDEICPCLQVRNTYDGTSRIALHIGAFRFVCTNLAVGGGGVFAGGFMSIHAGEIPIEAMGNQLADYLMGFDRIVELYRRWHEYRVDYAILKPVLDQALKGRFTEFRDQVLNATPMSAFEAYNMLTDFATHRMRSARSAFDLLESINATFQRALPSPEGIDPITVPANQATLQLVN